MSKVLIIDTEVASLETNEVIQLAWADAVSFGQGVNIQWFQPKGEWCPAAVAVHGIIPEDIFGDEPTSDEADKYLPECDYVIGHNVDFDADVLGGLPGVKRICTLALARAKYPQLNSHKLGALFLSIFGITRDNRDLVRGSHNASIDVTLCWRILQDVSDVEIGKSPDWAEKLYQQSEAARVPTVMMFGKHKGEEIKSIPIDYKRWLLKQPDVDPYLRKALER